MPNLFFTGKTSFVVLGSADQMKALKKALKENEQGIVFEYEFDDMPCTFYLHPFHIVKGAMTVEPSGDGFLVAFDGVAKIPLDKSSVNYLTGKEFTLHITGVTGGGYNVYINGKPSDEIASPLQISKTAPK